MSKTRTLLPVESGIPNKCQDRCLWYPTQGTQDVPLRSLHPYQDPSNLKRLDQFTAMFRRRKAFFALVHWWGYGRDGIHWSWNLTWTILVSEYQIPRCHRWGKRENWWGRGWSFKVMPYMTCCYYIIKLPPFCLCFIVFLRNTCHVSSFMLKCRWSKQPHSALHYKSKEQ
jgi:hypothetical protein